MEAPIRFPDVTVGYIKAVGTSPALTFQLLISIMRSRTQDLCVLSSMLLILSVLAYGCGGDVVEVDGSVPPALNDIFPRDELPSNGCLILDILPGTAGVNPKTLRISLDGVGGDVDTAYMWHRQAFIWKPKEQLPLGPAGISIKGESNQGVPIEVKQPWLLRITVVPPDDVPPTLANTFPPDGATDVDADKFNFAISFNYSEVIKWFDARVKFEPRVGVNGYTGQMYEIRSTIRTKDCRTVVAYLERVSVLSGGSTYTVTLSNIVDLAGNPGEDQQITFETRKESP